MNPMIERVARALHEALAGSDPDELIHHPAQKSWEEPRQRRWEQWEEAARAAVEAMRELIPVVRCDDGGIAHQLVGAPEDIWRTMIDAALA